MYTRIKAVRSDLLILFHNCLKLLEIGDITCSAAWLQSSCLTNNKQCLLGVIVRRSSTGSRYNSCFQTPDAWMNSRVFAWWRHQTEAFSCPGEFPVLGPITRSKRLKSKRLRKQSCGWWFETPSLSLWRHCNVVVWYGGSVNILFWIINVP